MNKFTGVVSVYNCQGAAWSSIENKNMFHQTEPGALTCGVKASDIHSISDAATDLDWNGNCYVYRQRDGELVVLSHNVVMPVSLKVLEHEILTISPIKVVSPGFSFAPFGLVDMYNAGGAIVGLSYAERETDAAGVACMRVKGCGRLRAYSSVKPRRCLLGSEDVLFSYDETSGFLSLQLENMPVVNEGVHKVIVEV